MAIVERAYSFSGPLSPGGAPVDSASGVGGRHMCCPPPGTSLTTSTRRVGHIWLLMRYSLDNPPLCWGVSAGGRGHGSTYPPTVRGTSLGVRHWSDNTAHWSDNTAHWPDNTAHWSANTAHWADDTAPWSDDTAHCSDNTAHWSDNKACYSHRDL